MAKSNQRWCSDGFEFRCDNGEPLRLTFALDCCDREAMSWVATTGGYSGDVVRDVMLTAVEDRFGDVLKAPSEIEWLTDNGSGYTAEKTSTFASDIGLEPLTTPVCSPESNGMAESFVKTMKRDYIAFMPKPDAVTAARNLAVAFEHYNQQHPHSAQKCRSPREFRRTTDSSTQVGGGVRRRRGKSKRLPSTQPSNAGWLNALGGQTASADAVTISLYSACALWFRGPTMPSREWIIKGVTAALLDQVGDIECTFGATVQNRQHRYRE